MLFKGREESSLQTRRKRKYETRLELARATLSRNGLPPSSPSERAPPTHHHHRSQDEVQAASCAFTAPSDGIRTVSYCVVVVPRRGQDVPTCEPTAHPHRDHQRAMSDAGTPWIDGTETRRLDVLACTAKCCPYDILANAANPQNKGEVEQPEGVHSFPRTFPLPRPCTTIH